MADEAEAIAPTVGETKNLSEWAGWDQSRYPWSEAKHKDAVLAALFRGPWSVEDAATLIDFIDRTWAKRPTNAGDTDAPPVQGWRPLTVNGLVMTCPMPADETIVDVMLNDGTVVQAWHSCNIMEAGDWDFLPVKDDGEPDDEADSIAAKIVAWRPSDPAPTGGAR